MAKRKHQPQRTCLACRAVKNKRELIRVVRTPEQVIIIDPTGKANGRGVYLCRQTDCLKKGLQTGRLSSALRTTVSPEDVTALQTEVGL